MKERRGRQEMERRDTEGARIERCRMPGTAPFVQLQQGFTEGEYGMSELSLHFTLLRMSFGKPDFRKV